MTHRGRKNRFDLIQPDGTGARSALSPMVPLTKVERSAFNLAVTQNPHLRPGDAVLLTTFALASSRVFEIAKRGGTLVEWDKATRILTSLARALRISPQSTVEAKTAGRMRRDAQPNSLDLFLAEDDDDDGTNT